MQRMTTRRTLTDHVKVVPEMGPKRGCGSKITHFISGQDVGADQKVLYMGSPGKLKKMTSQLNGKVTGVIWGPNSSKDGALKRMGT